VRCERRLCMRRNTGSFRTNLRYSRRYATSDDRRSVPVDICFPPKEPVRRKRMLDDERMSSDSGGGNFCIFRTGSSSMANFSWCVIPTARERPSAVVLRSGEDKHRVGMRARKWCDRDHPLARALFLPIHDHLRFTLGGRRPLSQTDPQW
jgi:hypothetical protein